MRIRELGAHGYVGGQMRFYSSGLEPNKAGQSMSEGKCALCKNYVHWTSKNSGHEGVHISHAHGFLSIICFPFE